MNERKLKAKKRVENSIEITERDMALIRWLNGFGFATADQVHRWMNVTQQVGSRRLKKLEGAGLIERERVLFRGGSIVRATGEGVKVSGDSLGRRSRFSLSLFEHDKQLIDLSLKLVAETPGSWFWPERRIRHEYGLKGYGEKGHVADGYLVTASGDRYAVELELTRKQRNRLRKIISEFQGDFDLAGVWYFCASDVVEYVREHAPAGDEFFRIEDLGDG